MKRYLYLAGGTIAFLLAIFGLAVRLLPTTPFLLISGWCYARSSDHLHQRLINSNIWKKTMKPLLEKGGLTLKNKLLILGWVWFLLSIIFISSQDPFIRGLIILLGLAKSFFFAFVVKTAPLSSRSSKKE